MSQPLTPEHEQEIRQHVTDRPGIGGYVEAGEVLDALDAARAEADRLREALGRIARDTSDEAARLTAREALAGAGGETPK